MKNYLLLSLSAIILFSCSYKEPKATFEILNNSSIVKNEKNILNTYQGIVKSDDKDSTVYSFDFYRDNTYVVKIDKINKDSTQIRKGTWVSDGNYYVVYGADASAYRFLKENGNLNYLDDDGYLYDDVDAGDEQFILYRK